jgi:hypothetical protein
LACPLITKKKGRIRGFPDPAPFVFSSHQGAVRSDQRSSSATWPTSTARGRLRAPPEPLCPKGNSGRSATGPWSQVDLGSDFIARMVSRHKPRAPGLAGRMRLMLMATGILSALGQATQPVLGPCWLATHEQARGLETQESSQGCHRRRGGTGRLTPARSIWGCRTPCSNRGPGPSAPPTASSDT